MIDFMARNYSSKKPVAHLYSIRGFGACLTYPYLPFRFPSLRRRSQYHHGILLGLGLKEDYAFLILLWVFYGVRLDSCMIGGVNWAFARVLSCFHG